MFLVRRAQANEYRLLAQLNQELIRDEAHRNQMGITELELRMQRWLAGNYEAHLFYLAKENIGYVLTRSDPEFLYVRQFFIRQESRRQGWGRTAFHWMMKNKWSQAKRIRLDVLIENEAGIAFWRSLGFSDYCLTMEFASRDDGSTPVEPI